MGSEPSKKSRRSITDQEISLIKAMLRRGMEKTTIQAYFTHPDRPVNYGRISNIEDDTYGPKIVAASDDELDRFLEDWRAKGDKTRARELRREAQTLPTSDPHDPAVHGHANVDACGPTKVIGGGQSGIHRWPSESPRTRVS